MFNINYKKISVYVFMLMFGMVLIVYGLFLITRPMPQIMTDAEIIKKAEELGMIHPKQNYLEKVKEEKND